MNWLRDNILKIFIILGVLVVVVVIVALVTKPKEENIVSGVQYGELETKLQNAAIKYVKNHKSILPTTTENYTKIKLKTLVDNRYIGKIVAVEDSSVKCDGYVEVSKISEDKKVYRYTPYISCGKYYVTKTIADHIIDVETEDGTFERKVDAGLYKSDDEYIFRGENVNNFILLDSHLYRIIKIDKDKHLKLISVTKTGNNYLWDDRYNIDADRNYGINTFEKSRLYDTLEFLYNNTDSDAGEVFFTDTERNYIVTQDFCIGKRSEKDKDVYSGAECKETVPLKVGLITVDEYAKASIDSNCKEIYDKSCFNYNYFNSLSKEYSYSYTTLTGDSDSSFKFYKIQYSQVEIVRTDNASRLYPVVFINNKTIYSSGTGTLTDPYVVR